MNADFLNIDRRLVVSAAKSLDWMIRYLEWANEQTGLEQGPSPELIAAIEARDELLKRINP